MNEYSFSLREETTFRESLFKRMDTQDGMLKDIKEQTTKTNGRVNQLEITTADYPKTKEITEDLKGWKMWLSGAVAIILLFGGGFITLFYQLQKSDQEKFIQETIEKERPQIIKETLSEINRQFNLQGIDIK